MTRFFFRMDVVLGVPRIPWRRVSMRSVTWKWYSLRVKATSALSTRPSSTSPPIPKLLYQYRCPSLFHLASFTPPYSHFILFSPLKNSCLRYVIDNELTRKLTIVHVYDRVENIPPKLKNNGSPRLIFSPSPHSWFLTERSHYVWNSILFDQWRGSCYVVNAVNEQDILLHSLVAVLDEMYPKLRIDLVRPTFFSLFSSVRVTFSLYSLLGEG